MSMTLAEALQLGILIAEAASKGIATAQAGKAMVEQMVADQRDPTPEEVAQLRAVTTALHEAIQSA
jgi:hypothetical protein